MAWVLRREQLEGVSRRVPIRVLGLTLSTNADDDDPTPWQQAPMAAAAAVVVVVEELTKEGE